MSSGGGGGPHKKARIEIIPLIDIMFFLLASFMLVSMSMIKLQAVQNDLPDARKGENVTKQDFHTVGIDKFGNYYIDKEKDPIPSDRASEIYSKLLPFYNDKKDDLKVFVNADKDITYNMLITVLDQLRSLGVKKVSFAVKKGHAFTPAAPGAPPPSQPLRLPRYETVFSPSETKAKQLNENSARWSGSQAGPRLFDARHILASTQRSGRDCGAMDSTGTSTSHGGNRYRLRHSARESERQSTDRADYSR